jgi:hypothetical protein
MMAFGSLALDFIPGVEVVLRTVGFGVLLAALATVTARMRYHV